MPTEMELTLEQTQQGVSYEVSYDESNTYVLERFNTTAGNPVKKILLKLNLSDHRSILTDSKVDDLKMLKITMSNTSSRNKLNPEINDHYNIFTGECQKDELKTQDKAFDRGNPKARHSISSSSAHHYGSSSHHGDDDEDDDEEDDLEENLEDPEECGEDKANTILGVIHDKLNNDWFNNTSEDEEYLEGILDYLKAISYDGFIDLDDEAYNKKRCKLLGMTFEEPNPILIEKAKVARYTVSPGETYTKVKIFFKDMDQDSAHMVAASKVPMLKPGEYEIWRMRIEQYIQMIDYALWEVIENGATLPKTTTVEGVVTEMPITTAEEKA
ncbi:hypothetical protein Tco_0073233 [Tanacetum coccineum]